MIRECQKRAKINYRKKCKQVTIQFNLEIESEKQCYSKLVKIGNKSNYIKMLIKRDILEEKTR